MCVMQVLSTKNINGKTVQRLLDETSNLKRKKISNVKRVGAINEITIRQCPGGAVTFSYGNNLEGTVFSVQRLPDGTLGNTYRDPELSVDLNKYRDESSAAKTLKTFLKIYEDSYKKAEEGGKLRING